MQGTVDRLSVTISLLAVALLLLAGCEGDSDDDGDAAASQDTTQTDGNTPASQDTTQTDGNTPASQDTTQTDGNTPASQDTTQDEGFAPESDVGGIFDLGSYDVLIVSETQAYIDIDGVGMMSHSYSKTGPNTARLFVQVDNMTLTFTSATAGSYVSANGVIKAFTYSPPTGERLTVPEGSNDYVREWALDQLANAM